MEHLQCLCSVFGITLDEAAGGPSTEALTDEEQAWMRLFRELKSGEDREYLLGLGAQLARRPR